MNLIITAKEKKKVENKRCKRKSSNIIWEGGNGNI